MEFIWLGFEPGTCLMQGISVYSHIQSV